MSNRFEEMAYEPDLCPTCEGTLYLSRQEIEKYSNKLKIRLSSRPGAFDLMLEKIKLFDQVIKTGKHMRNEFTCPDCRGEGIDHSA